MCIFRYLPRYRPSASMMAAVLWYSPSARFSKSEATMTTPSSLANAVKVSVDGPGIGPGSPHSRKGGSMASLRHHVAPLLAFALVAGCGGDRSRTAAGGDTTGAAAATPDSTGMPAGTTAAPAAADTARSAAADTSG